MIFENWDMLIKSHRYSRKEFKNGVWRYYYDKNRNFSRMTRCKSEPLKIDSSMSSAAIVSAARNYIENVWLPDWRKKEDLAICKELKGKKISFESISYQHLSVSGGHSINGKRRRDFKNILDHVRYLPLAKELLEENGVHTQSRYEKFKKVQKDGSIGLIYQTVSGLAPKGDKNKYVQVAVSQKKYADGKLSNTVYISVVGTADIKKTLSVRQGLRRTSRRLRQGCESYPAAKLNITFPNDCVNISISDITEGNRKSKYEQLEKCLNGGVPKYIPADDTPRLGSVNIKIKEYSNEKVEKALRTMAFCFDIPLKGGNGESFFYKAQEDLTDKWCVFFSEFTHSVYEFITDYFNLPKKTVMRKAMYLKYKGKILYYPETGEPIPGKDWKKFVELLEKFLNKHLSNCEEGIVLQSKTLGRILNRMLKYNTLEAVKNAELNKLEYHGKTFDWISSSVSNMKDTFGEVLTRTEQARIQTYINSAAVKVQNISDKMKGEIKQVLVDGIKNRQGKSVISQALFDKMVGDNRDFQRLADTEIQNSVNNAFISEEVYKTPEGEKAYFQRIEVIDDNTCDFCKKMNGEIVLWSDSPLESEKIKDSIAKYAIWEGKEWNGKGHTLSTGVFHPYCRGVWTRYNEKLNKEDYAMIDALVAENSGKAKKWNKAVETARKEFEKKGFKNPSDATPGFTSRIHELFKELKEEV